MTGCADAGGRALARCEQLFRLGPEPHAHRPGLSRDEQAAIELAAGWMREAGLTVAIDPAGNLVGRLRGRDPALPEVWSGSHLDTVPGGGRFDGALGVVAAVEAVDRLRREGVPARTVAAVAFRDEEGWRFGRGVFGSRALCGRLAPGELERADADGVTIAQALAQLGLDPPPAGGWGRPGIFVELHVEQGPTLADRGAAVGVVSGIVGMAGGEVTFSGRAGHAGTVPMSGRADAACAAAAFVLAVRAAAAAIPGAVATVGRLDVRPGATNVVPGRAVASFDARASHAEALERLVAAVDAAAEAAAARHGCAVSIEGRWQEPVISMSPHVRTALAGAAAACGQEAVELASGAGHDAGILAGSDVATGMLFVPSLRGGVSHTPEEHTDPQAVAAGIDVLTAALRTLAAG